MRRCARRRGMSMTWVRWRSRGIYPAFQSSARCATRSTSGASLRLGRCPASGRAAGTRTIGGLAPRPDRRRKQAVERSGRTILQSQDLCPRQPGGLRAHQLTTRSGDRRGGSVREASAAVPGLFTPSGSRLRAWLVRRVVPHRPAPRLPAGDREVSPDGLVLVQRLGARAVAPLPGHQHAPRAPLVPVRAPLRIAPPVRPLHAHLYD
jgi:hypothetical protein